MKKGFTIVELLAIIIVIVVLIWITLPRFRSLQDRGNIAKAKRELMTLQASVESYYVHNKSIYPALLADLISVTPNIIGAALPKDPFGAGEDYSYMLSPDKRYYVIYSVGSAGTGSALVNNSGSITEINGPSCIYVSNAGRDLEP